MSLPNAPIPQPPARLELRFESHPAQIGPARRAVEDFARRAGLDPAACADVGLCLNEALANIIRHAYSEQPGQPILLRAEWVAGPPPALRLTLRDWGNGVNPASLPPKPYDPLEPGGVGLLCLRSLMHEVTYVPQADGMLVVLVRHDAPLPARPGEDHGSSARADV